jgi:sulfur carrier protein ThiS
LFDLQYTNNNSFGVTGDYYRVFLIDREDGTGNITNNVGEFISDYYSTIKLVDTVDIGAQIVNIISGAININAQVGFGELNNQSRFALIVQRILGLCFDDRREIDVSGVAKVAELDGVDDSFFELNEIDLRNIEVEISNVQNGIMEFEDCDNIKLPVNSQVLIDELINFRNTLSGDTVETQVETLGQIIDSISDNPEWSITAPTNLNVKVSIDKSVIKKIPLAVAASVLTPKNLLPLYTLLAVVQSGATFTYNQAVTETNTTTNQITSFGNQGADIGAQSSNIVNSGEDFLKKYKTFAIQVISQINAEFLKVLYEILKKDIVNLVSAIIGDISKSKLLKKYAIILRLAQLVLIVSQLINDYRRCKSLLDNISLILNLVGQIPVPSPTGSGTVPLITEIPLPLLALSSLLPGYSPERASINAIELLQKLSIPTGTLPDGSPNLMLLYNLATNKANDKEQAENGKVEIVTAVGPGVGKTL